MIQDEWFFAVTLGKKTTKCNKIFGLNSFSESLTAKPFPGIIDEGLTGELTKWFEDRQSFLLARLRNERPKSIDKDKDKLKRLKIQCVKTLKEKYQIRDREIGEQEDYSFLENLSDDGQAILYLRSDIITNPFCECRDLTSHMAKNLEYWLDAPNYKDAFKSLLSCKNKNDLIKELEDAHVSLGVIEECKKLMEEKREIKNKGKKIVVEEPKQIEEVDDGKKEDEAVIKKPELKPDVPRWAQPEYIGSELELIPESIGGGGNGRGGEEGDQAPDRDRKVTGQRGENILFEYLKSYLQHVGFDADCEILHTSKNDPQSVYDIQITDKIKGIFYLEVKSSNNNRPTLSFEMSDRQWKFAGENQSRYQLWFVFDLSSNKPKISGPHKPLELEKLGKLKRTIKEEIVYLCKVKFKN